MQVKSTALALSYFVAEYGAPVWARSPHEHKLNTELNSTCRAVTGCLKQTNIDDLYLLAVIAPPPDIRRDVYAKMEKPNRKLMKLTLYIGNTPSERRLKSKNCFVSIAKPAELSPNAIRCNE